jgi:solute carrier family 45 protein 1/2/4
VLTLEHHLQIVLGFSSFLIEPLCKKLGPRVVWVSSNFVVCIAMAATTIISWWATITVSKDIKVVCMAIFSFLGLPLAVIKHCISDIGSAL